MKVSLSWLKDYIDIRMDVADLADALTMAGLEVDSVTDRYAYLHAVLVGRVAEVTPHPNADKLTISRVEAEDHSRMVVCGAPNVAEGMLALSRRIGFPTTLSQVEGFTDEHIERCLTAARNPKLEMKLRHMPVPLSAETVDEYMGPILEAAATGDFGLIRNMG